MLKKLIMICCAAALLLSALSFCAGASDAVRVVCLKGPTGMGLAKLMEDASAGAHEYEFRVVSSPDELAAAFIRGEADIMAMPSNMAAILWNRTGGELRALSVSVTGALAMLTRDDDIRSIADLRGKTIVAAGRGASPEYALNFLLRANGIEPGRDCTTDWRSEQTEVVSNLLSGKAYDAAMLPHPFADVTLMRDASLREAFSLADEWRIVGGGSELVIGLNVTSRSFAESRPDAVGDFLSRSAESAEYVRENPHEAAKLIVRHGILDDAAVAERAIPGCGITSLRDQEMKDALSGYLKVLFDASPKSVGGALPDDSFYYTHTGR